MDAHTTAQHAAQSEAARQANARATAINAAEAARRANLRASDGSPTFTDVTPDPDTYTADTRRGNVDRNGPESNTSTGEAAGEPTIPQRAECDICGEPGEMDRPILGGTHTDCDDREAEAVPVPAPVAGGEPTPCPKCAQFRELLAVCPGCSQPLTPAVAPVAGAGGEAVTPTRAEVDALADELGCSTAPIKNQAARMLQELRRQRDRLTASLDAERELTTKSTDAWRAVSDQRDALERALTEIAALTPDYTAPEVYHRAVRERVAAALATPTVAQPEAGHG